MVPLVRDYMQNTYSARMLFGIVYEKYWAAELETAPCLHPVPKDTLLASQLQHEKK